MGLFGGKTDTQPAPASKPAGGRPQTSISSRETMEAPTVIGEQSVVKGELESRTDMLVEGRVEGQIKGAKRVIIGEKGNIEARVQADVIIVRGTVNGDLHGDEKVEITATGKVFGNITSKAIVVAEGATFRGSSKMAHGSTGSTSSAKPDVSSSGSKQTADGGSGSTASPSATSGSAGASTSAPRPN